MKPPFFIIGLLVWLATSAHADTSIVVTNGSGLYYLAYDGMAFSDANGNYVFIGGTQGFVEIFYTNGTYLVFEYNPATQTFSGVDERGRFTAVVHETLETIHRGGGGGRGDGYPGYITVVVGGEIDYTYADVTPRRRGQK